MVSRWGHHTRYADRLWFIYHVDPSAEHHDECFSLRVENPCGVKQLINLPEHVALRFTFIISSDLRSRFAAAARRVGILSLGHSSRRRKCDAQAHFVAEEPLARPGSGCADCRFCSENNPSAHRPRLWLLNKSSAPTKCNNCTVSRASRSWRGPGTCTGTGSGLAGEIRG